MFRVLDVTSNNVLYHHVGKLDSLPTSTLRSIIYQVYADHREATRLERFNEFIQSSTEHRRIQLNAEVLEMRNKATKLRHENQKRKRDAVSETIGQVFSAKRRKKGNRN